VAGRCGIGCRGRRGLDRQQGRLRPRLGPDALVALPVAVLVGWSLIGSGLVAAMIFTGFAWFASLLSDAQNPVLFMFGEVVYPFYYAGFLYLILWFPSGQLRARPTAR
jgi:hypothetical protein